jgi:hypothetical protein
VRLVTGFRPGISNGWKPNCRMKGRDPCNCVEDVILEFCAFIGYTSDARSSNAMLSGERER